MVIEYQCSRVKVDDLRKRTDDYIKAGIKPIWIIGKTPSKNGVISDFELSFYNNGKIIYYKDGFFIRNIQANVSKNKFIADIKKYKREKIGLETLIENSSTKKLFGDMYREEFRNSASKQIDYIIKFNKKLARIIYEKQIKTVKQMIIFDDYIEGQFIVNESPLIMQILLKNIFLSEREVFTFNDLKKFIMRNFTIRTFIIQSEKNLFDFIYNLIKKLFENKMIKYVGKQFKIVNKMM